MTIQKTATTTPATQAHTEATTGNKTASDAAKKARGIMETVIGPELTPKLSELPTTEARLMALADAIERAELVKQGVGFNMGRWFAVTTAIPNKIRTAHACGTVACLAGWTAVLEDGQEGMHEDKVYRRAINILGITDGTAKELFVPEINGGPAHLSISAEHAVAVVRNLARTGKVEWNKFDSDGKEKP